MTLNGYDRDTLTAHEIRVMELVARGLPDKAIGPLLHVSSHATKFHISNAYRKLGVNSRTQAVWRCLELGLIEPPRTEGAHAPVSQKTTGENMCNPPLDTANP